MLLYFKTNPCILTEYSSIKMIFFTYLNKISLQ